MLFIAVLIIHNEMEKTKRSNRGLQRDWQIPQNL